jgi:hypothetical protein
MSTPKNLNKAMVPSQEAMVANLLAWHSLALSTPAARQHYNQHWYSFAHDEIEKVALELGITTHTMCQVVAATSPGMSWEVNVESAKQVVIACQNYLAWEDRQMHLRSVHYQVGYTWENAKNGCDAFAGIDIPKTRKKTYDFGQCLEFPEVLGLVSPVDMHMIHIACNTHLKGSIQPGSHYGAISKAITFAANLLGMDEKQFQSLLWGTRVDFFKAGLSVDTIYAVIADLAERGKES